MKDIITYINEAKTNTNSDSWIAIEIVLPNDNPEDDKKEKRSKRVVNYSTYVNMKNSGYTTNGKKIISINAIGKSVTSKEKVQEYKKINRII